MALPCVAATKKLKVSTEEVSQLYRSVTVTHLLSNSAGCQQRKYFNAEIQIDRELMRVRECRLYSSVVFTHKVGFRFPGHSVNTIVFNLFMSSLFGVSCQILTISALQS